MKLTSDLNSEMLELKSKHLAVLVWLITLIISLAVTASYPIKGKWYLFGLEIACVFFFQIYAIFLKKKIRRINETLLVREIIES